MDHHCYWTNNCVGRRNHKQFILFLTYTVLLSLMSFVIDLLWTILYFVPQIQAQTTFLSKVAHSLQIAYLSPSFVYCLIFLVESARILGSQFDIIATNITTIEALNPKSYLVRSLARQGIEQHKFDRGSWLQNVKWFMGDKILLWWIPLNLSMPTSLFPIHTTPSDVESSDSQSSNSTQQDLRDVSRLPLDLELEDEVESDALAAQVMWLEKERTRMGISFDNERVASDSSGQSKGHRSQRTRTNRKRRRQLEVQRRAMADSSSSGT
ncbi:putative DHHC palmitoyltransferase [Blattamonas nauphoetae]|uniref:Palmitoyltransferase n=1 Tax=Blattamonas nauphoetae TaxID=2049346 RepID=A0ABQ9XVU1_9EUKA|nr:putative DHHC palmitoyltransferase [Blattamonas nauphoetae]